MKQCPNQLISFWIGDVKTQVHLIKDICIALPDFIIIIVLTAKFDSIVVMLKSIGSNIEHNRT